MRSLDKRALLHRLAGLNEQIREVVLDYVNDALGSIHTRIEEIEDEVRGSDKES